jgi:two-component system LytT family sensor kinase
MDPVVNPSVLFGQLIGYGLSSTLAVVLAILAWQSPDSGRHVRALNAACAAVWSLGGLTRFGLLAAGLSPQSTVVSWISCLTFSAAAAWPVCLLLFWKGSGDVERRPRTARRLLAVATAVAGIPVAGLIAATLEAPQWLDVVRLAVGYTAVLVLLAGILILQPRFDSAVERAAVALIPGGPLISLAAHWLQHSAIVSIRWDPVLDVVVKQSMLLTMLGVLVYLGRFQASDRFAKLGLRVVWAWTLGIAVAWLITRHPDDEPALRTPTDAVATAVICAAVAGAVLLFGWFGRASDRWVDRRVFGRRDPQLALADLRERLARQETEASLCEATEQFFRDTLNVEVRVLPAGQSIAAGDRFSVQVGESEPLALCVRRSTRRGLLLSSEMDLVRQGAQLVGRRLEALARERERIELSQREANLMHQLVQAELRALRAQINPHFLFNSLNTIAELVHQDPALAEAMTLRLARIFRYVLTQTDQSFTPLREEIDFLRAYLDIEQMRFGERLQIQFQVAEAVADRPIPSLILQPLVENAIKHGFSPKVGPCRLVICGAVQDEQLVLSVEDNGVGTWSGEDHDAPRSGIGLRNVRERLATVYGARAHLSFESQPRQGSRATVYLPLNDTAAAPA